MWPTKSDEPNLQSAGFGMLAPPLKGGSSVVRDVACGKTFRWIARRRGLLISLAGATGIANVLWGHAQPVDFLGSDRSPLAWGLWGLALLGVIVRFWAAGNLRKKQEVTRTGIYRMVRHPLYLGNCLIYLAFFLSFGDLALGLGLFFLVLIPVHLLTMLREEEQLAKDYPEQLAAHQGIPRLVPNLFALREALATDRFTLRQALRNRAAGCLWALLLLPLVMELLQRVDPSL
jgi:protein-S-isoprenylcysteine O-methyltransferase Ste14